MRDFSFSQPQRSAANQVGWYFTPDYGNLDHISTKITTLTGLAQGFILLYE